MPRLFSGLTMVAVVALLATFTSAQQPLSPSALREHPQIAYSRTQATDPVARLNQRLRAGEVVLNHDDRNGFLRSVLAALDVPIDSQVLVFSKTSFQAAKIGPRTPRALYFNDTVSVGWVRGGEVLELAAQDPALGTIFYTLDQSSAATPQFERNAACVQCHTSDATVNVPGMFATSVYPDTNGTSQYALLYSTDHRKPFDTRWGGWYVTGRHRGEHIGNAFSRSADDVAVVPTPETTQVERLEGRFDTAPYLLPGSDLVALLVLEHQMHLLNLLTRAGWEARVGAALAGRPLQQTVNELVDYLLFVDEAALPGPVTGSSTFMATFAQRGPRDRQGRSLRELNLRDRVFEYPCSFLIYSDPFDQLPAQVKGAVYARMHEILTGRATDPRYARLSASRRSDVIDILADTKPDLPAYFRSDSLAAGSP